jgi:hypothetical protein
MVVANGSRIPPKAGSESQGRKRTPYTAFNPFLRLEFCRAPGLFRPAFRSNQENRPAPASRGATCRQLGYQTVTNGGHRIWIPGFWIPGFWIPGFWIPGFWIPGFWIPGFWIPGFWIPGFWILGFWIVGFWIPGFWIPGFWIPGFWIPGFWIPGFWIIG